MSYWFVYEEVELPIAAMLDIMGEETNKVEKTCFIVAQRHDGRWLSTGCRYHDIVERKPH